MSFIRFLLLISGWDSNLGSEDKSTDFLPFEAQYSPRKRTHSKTKSFTFEVKKTLEGRKCENEEPQKVSR